MEGLRKTMENVSQDSQSRDQNFTLGPSEYDAGILTTRPRCSVNVDVTRYNLHLRFDVEPSYTSRKNSLTAINVFRQIRQTYWCLLNIHLALITAIGGR